MDSESAMHKHYGGIIVPMSAEPKVVLLYSPKYIPPYTSHMLHAKQEAGSETQLTVIVLVLAKIVGQFKIIECFGLKPVSHLTVACLKYIILR